MAEEETNQEPPGHTPLIFHLQPGSHVETVTSFSRYELSSGENCVV